MVIGTNKNCILMFCNTSLYQTLFFLVTSMWRGQGAGARENRGREGYGRQEEKGGKRDFQIGENWEKRRKILQYCVTFHNRNRTKRRKPLRKGAGSRSKRYRRQEFQTPCHPEVSAYRRFKTDIHHHTHVWLV